VWLKTIARLAFSAPARADLTHELRRRAGGVPTLGNMQIQSILVVCHGNICRSPFAERLLRARVPSIEAASAGLQATSGTPADTNAARAASAFGVDLATHSATLLTNDLIAGADLVLGMEGRHRREIVRSWPGARAKTFLLGDFLMSAPHRIEDPWGCDDETFLRVFQQIEQAVVGLRRVLGIG
jgi:protein-tyrosine phosphatase